MPARAPTPAPAEATAPVAALRTPLPAADTCRDSGLVPTAASVERARTAAVCLVNRTRARQGLRPLRVNARLQTAAQSHADDMLAQNYFGHLGPTGSDPLSRIVATGYALDSAGLIGENVAVGASALATPEATLEGWMGQPDHRANILDPGFTETGVSVLAAIPTALGMGSAGATYVESFAASHDG